MRRSNREGAAPLTDREALEVIRLAWLAWAKAELSEAEFAAGVAEALEGAGLELVRGVEGTANDGG